MRIIAARILILLAACAASACKKKEDESRGNAETRAAADERPPPPGTSETAGEPGKQPPRTAQALQEDDLPEPPGSTSNPEFDEEEAGQPESKLNLLYSMSTLDGIVRNLWTNIAAARGDSSCPGFFDYEPGGLRVAYCKASAIVTYETLASKLPVAIWKSGPHSNTALALAEPKSFGHYNPAFVKWLSEHAIPAATDSKLFDLSLDPYKKQLRVPARMFLFARRFMKEKPVKAAELRRALEAYMKGPSDGIPSPHYAYWELIPELRAYEAQMIAGSGIGFWLRRSMDGTDRLFEDVLRKILRVYDAQWLEEFDRTPWDVAKKELDSWAGSPPMAEPEDSMEHVDPREGWEDPEQE